MKKMAWASNRSGPAALPVRCEGCGGAENEKAPAYARARNLLLTLCQCRASAFLNACFLIAVTFGHLIPPVNEYFFCFLSRGVWAARYLHYSVRNIIVPTTTDFLLFYPQLVHAPTRVYLVSGDDSNNWIQTHKKPGAWPGFVCASRYLCTMGKVHQKPQHDNTFMPPPPLFLRE